MSNKEIEKFIKKNIIGHIGNDLVQKGTYILKYPIKDILGGFCFEPSASDKNSIYIWWFVQPLYVPCDMLHLTFGKRLEHSNRNQSWSNLDSIDSVEEIRQLIKKNIPLIESLIEPTLFYNHYNIYMDRCKSLIIDEALVYTAIWIRSPNWRQEAQNLITCIDNDYDTSIPWIGQIKEGIININLSSNPRNILEDTKKNLIKLLNL